MITAVQNEPSYTIDEIIDGYHELCGETPLTHGCPFGDEFECTQFEVMAERVIMVVKQYLKEMEKNDD
jgi:hypothetical protein